MDPTPPVAIVGMACIFPGAGDLASYWKNLVAGHDAIREVPATRWEPVFFDPESTRVDRLYCKRGGFIDEFAQFDALHWGVMPLAAQGYEPDQLLTLATCAAALADAGLAERDFPRETTGVILGRGGYLNSGMARFASKVRTSQELVQCLERLVPGLSSEQLEGVRAEFQARLGHHGPDTVIGIVPNLAASRVANRLDLKGPSYTIDAACASSLIAVDRACADLVTGRSDVVLAGGVHLTHDVAFWSVFCQLGALSRRQEIRPFDRAADGILMGEGVGVVVLERLADAERNGRRVYAVIRGTGTSSDGREASLMTPAAGGQLLALERAWRAAGLDPSADDAVGLLEAHGTGTPAGDLAELSTLARFFGPPRGERAGLGSVKSMIGHAMPAAGVAGLIKAALALHHGVRPPTLHCDEPHEMLAETRFRIVGTAEPWDAPADERTPRRAGVNAFGFGGINAHALLEEHRPVLHPGRGVRVGAPAAHEAPEAVLLLAADSGAELVALLERAPLVGAPPGRGTCRIAVVDPSPERLARARSIVARGAPFHGKKGFWFSPAGLLGAGGKLAFLFPGVDADSQQRADDVARFFGREALPDDPGLARSSELERKGVAIVWTSRLLFEVLGELGLEPDFVAGHSIGEWSAMIAAGAVAPESVNAFLAGLEPNTLRVPGVVFAVAGCSRERAEPLLTDLEDVAVSLDNCRHQVVLCGREASVDQVLARLAAERVLGQKLDFQSGFHTPLFEPFAGPMRRDIESLPIAAPRLPLWSATTCAPFPSDPAAIRALFTEHLIKPVRFRELVGALYAEGARAFVQVGAGSLVGFVGDILHDVPHLAVAALEPRRSGLAQLRRLVAALWVEGAELEHARLIAPPPEAARARATRPTRTGPPPMQLALGAPLVQLETPLDLPRSAAPARPALDTGVPVLAELAATLDAVERSGADVARAFGERARARPAPAPASAPEKRPAQRRTLRRLDWERCPFLLDHCFFRQPSGWPNPGDRYPVVPMTMSLGMLVGAARELAPGRVVVGIERVRAWRWIAVERPLEIAIDAKRLSSERVRVEIEGYFEGEVLLAERYPAAPAADFAPCVDEAPLPMDERALYDERWMFHGPAYQGVVEMLGMGPDGIRGRIEERAAEGVLLDCAGQLMGLWINLSSERDKMAMPVLLESVRFFGPDPAPGERFDCRVWIRSHGQKQVRADLEVSRGGRVWCRLDGWEDRRFETNAQVWPVMRFPETSAVGVPHPRVPGVVVVDEGFAAKGTRDYFARRFLDGREIETYDTLAARRQIDWLSGRIAAKDAARHHLWRNGLGPIFPIEVEVHVEASGRPLVRVAERLGTPRLAVSIAHKDGLAAALVREARAVGLDVERVEPRDDAFLELAFAPAERALLPASPGRARDEAIARAWAAKEALGKRRGSGLEHNPRRLVVGALGPPGASSWVEVDGVRVETLVEGERVWAWTEDA